MKYHGFKKLFIAFISSQGMIRFGPAGLGGVKVAVDNLRAFHKLGITACEVAFTYGVYLKEKEAKEIGKAALDLDIRLSIHAPYWVNLSSSGTKLEMTKKRILDSCKIGDALGARVVVFHPGYYGKMSKEETYSRVKEAILDMLETRRKEGWALEIAAETMGKINVFGSLDEILRLVKETGCGFCIDFAHLLARSQGKMQYREMYDQVAGFKKLHCHFSGIHYGDKGEKNHIPTPLEELKKLLSVLPRNKDITIINESPDPVEDSIKGMRIWEKLG